MDKYQKYLIGKRATAFDQISWIDKEKPAWRYKNRIDYTSDVFEVKQDDDIEITKYYIVIKDVPVFKKVYYLQGEEWIEAKRLNVLSGISKDDEKIFKSYLAGVEVDFAHPIEKIKVTLKSHMADDYIITLKYTKTDPETYYAMKKAKRMKELEKAASVKHSLGYKILNIYFQPCSNEVANTEIELYVELARSEWRLIKKTTLPKDDLFYSVDALAYGTYSYILRQVDEKNETLFETKRTKFTLSPPSGEIDKQ